MGTMSPRADVWIYLTSWCPYCSAAKQLLKRKNVSFTEVDVDGRDDLRGWLRSASGQRTVPQVFINGESVGGFSDIDELDRQGKLDALLAAAPKEGAAAMPR
jgi:glutaredoxin 3